MSLKRAYCTSCLRPERACICACANIAQSEIEVLILQHPDEVRHIKGTARLLHLCLPNSRLIELDKSDETTLADVLNEGGRQNVLLYPDVDFLPLTLLSVADITPASLRLILIDATWRHSRRILQQYPSLQSLPRLTLSDLPASRYQIRRAHKADQLSTLEACTYALMRLDGSESAREKYGALLTAFERFNERQVAFGVNRLVRGDVLG